MTETAIIPIESRQALMPAMSLSMAAERRQAIVDFTKSLMVKGIDYGVVPGTGNKPTLLKPGAEKLASLFALAPQFEAIEATADWTGEEHGGEPFFYYRYRCTLYRNGQPVGQGEGSCNSWEKKYRYRNVYPNRATAEEKAAGRLETRSGRNGSTYQVYVVKNSDPADIVNTVQKMSQKRALVAAVLVTVNASEFFTQDVEDMDFGGLIAAQEIAEGEFEEVGRPATNGNGHERAASAETSPGEWDGTLDPMWREKLAKGRPTVGTVCSVVAAACSYYANEHHALQALDGMSKSERLDNEEAVSLFDQLVERARARLAEKD